MYKTNDTCQYRQKNITCRQNSVTLTQKKKTRKTPISLKKTPHHKLTSHTQKPEEEDGEDTEL